MTRLDYLKLTYGCSVWIHCGSVMGHAKTEESTGIHHRNGLYFYDFHGSSGVSGNECWSDLS